MSTDLPGEALVVTPSFFGYERSIAAELESLGHRVTLLDERPDNTSYTKAAARVAPSLIAARLRRHYRDAAATLAGRRLSLVVVVKAEVVPVWFLDHLRRTNPGCVFVFYAFDSFANAPRGERLLDRFDHAFSFDRDDVARVPGLRYKPLFSAREFVPGAPLEHRPVDLAFVGTLHSGRYDVCRQLAPAGEVNDFFFYSPARWNHSLNRLRDPGVRAIPVADVSYTKRTRADVAEAFASARAVIDVQRTGQSGLTMRTFEVLATGAKLVTTNASITAEPFHDPRWVHVLPEDRAAWDVEALRRFVEDPTPVPADLMAPYSIRSWVREFSDLVSGRALDVAS
ncbi:hypothetical protein [Nocardioides litoris]|uniref:hypothetical protein n=1 Tax=Nocardioides litoris TaxID=1926648 RepID=UPI0011229634|nr:hypothetical protein [Nocardioides litoris]